MKKKMTTFLATVWQVLLGYVKLQKIKDNTCAAVLEDLETGNTFSTSIFLISPEYNMKKKTWGFLSNNCKTGIDGICGIQKIKL